MKKFLAILLLTVITAIFVLAGCSQPAPAPAPAPAPTPTPTPTPALTPTPTPAPTPTPTASPKPTTKPVVLKALSAFPMGQDVSTKVIGVYAELLKQKTNGMFQINWIGGPEAIAARDQPQALMVGVIDLVVTPAAYYEKYVPQIAVCNLAQYSAAEQQARGIYDYWNTVHEPGLNAHFLGFVNFGGGYYLYLNREIKDPKTDFKGLKIRTGAIYDSFLKALGAVPVTIAGEDAYNALQTKVVDGAGWPPEQFSSFKGYEVAKYIVNHPFYATALNALINLDRWKALPKEWQDLLVSVCNEANKAENAMFFARQDALAKKFLDLGVKNITFSPDDAAWYVKLANDTKWNEAKKTLKPEDWDKLYKILNK